MSLYTFSWEKWLFLILLGCEPEKIILKALLHLFELRNKLHEEFINLENKDKFKIKHFIIK